MQIERKTKAGFTEKVFFDGPSSAIPKGWKESTKETTKNQSTLTLTRNSPSTGFRECIEFSGAFSAKPAGWSLATP